MPLPLLRPECDLVAPPDRTNTPNSCGIRPVFKSPTIQFPTVALPVLAPERLNCRRWAVKHGNGVATVITIAIDIGHRGAEPAVCCVRIWCEVR